MKNKLIKFKNWLLTKKAVFMLAITGLVLSASAEDGTAKTDVQDLWGKLDLKLKDFFEDVFTALSSPVGVVLAVIFVMALFYLVVRLATRSVNPSRRV